MCEFSHGSCPWWTGSASAELARAPDGGRDRFVGMWMVEITARSTAMRLPVDVGRDNAFCRMNRADTGIGGRSFGTQLGPGFQVVKRVHDAAADVAVLGPRSTSTVLLERPAGEAEEARRLGRAQKARWQAGERRSKVRQPNRRCSVRPPV